MVAVKSTLEKSDVEQILAHYNVGVIERVKAFTTGTVQTNILLYTTRGRFVLRYYECNRSFNSVLFEVNLIKYLKHKNYPCPAVVGNTHGKFAACYKDKPYALFEFLEGTHVQHPNERQKQQLIQKVAELQNLTRNYRSLNIDGITGLNSVKRWWEIQQTR
jgi:Ser/Thr protein kinase RdoA (MazF antagonist)